MKSTLKKGDLQSGGLDLAKSVTTDSFKALCCLDDLDLKREAEAFVVNFGLPATIEEFSDYGGKSLADTH